MACHARLADRDVGFTPLQPRLPDRRRFGQRARARIDQRFVVEGHAVRGLVFDAVPQCLELRTVQYGLARSHGLAFVGVPDFQTPGKSA